jgi:membrane fusion protein, multidrug efflux system
MPAARRALRWREVFAWVRPVAVAREVTSRSPASKAMRRRRRFGSARARKRAATISRAAGCSLARKEGDRGGFSMNGMLDCMLRYSYCPAVKTNLFAMLVVGAVVVGLGTGVGRAADEGGGRAVKVVVAEKVARPVTEEVVGSVRTRLRAVIEAKVSGRIASMPVVLGQQVREGDLLAEIDAREIQARLEQAEAQNEQASKDLERMRVLARKEVASRQDLDAAEAKASVAEAALREARTMLGYARVTAPFDGVVSRRLAEVGDLAAPGRPLLEVEDRGELRFEADVPEALIGMVAGGDEIEVGIPAAGETFLGKVVEVSPTADAASRTFLVKLDLPSSPALRAGQFGRAAVPVGEAESIRVPTDALVRRGQMEIVFVEEGGKAVLRLVRIGKEFPDGVEVLAGLSEGDRVVVGGVGGLVDGQELEVAE